jgi:hypothetical protein
VVGGGHCTAPHNRPSPSYHPSRDAAPPS